MKNTLITLVANEQANSGGEAIFRSLFNEDIVIEPNSEIAMQSVSLNKLLNMASPPLLASSFATKVIKVFFII